MTAITATATLILLIVWPWSPQAQAGRLASYDGQWLLPVANPMLGSDEHDHVQRGSINAWDLTVTTGTPVYATGPGQVAYAGCNNQGGYGCWVLVDHANGWQSKYAHLDAQPHVATGQRVDASTLLGHVGMTGMTSWPHLHFVVMVNGTHGMLDQIWPKSALVYCKFCWADEHASPPAPTLEQRATTWAMWASGLLILGLLAWLLWTNPEIARRLALTAWRATRASVAWAWDHRPSWLMVATDAVLIGGIPAVVVVSVALVTTAGSLPGLGTMPGLGMAAWAMPDLGGIYYPAAIQFVLGEEGGLADHPRDPGGRTMAGVTQATYDAHRRSQGQAAQNVDQISQAEIQAIYLGIWEASHAEQMPSQRMAISHFDWATNAGTSRALRTLASCTGLGQDPGWTPTHRLALATTVATVGEAGLFDCYNDARERFYRSSDNFDVFGQGWLNRLSRVRALTP